MSASQSKIELVLEVRNQIRSGLSQARSQIDTEVGRMRSRMSQFTSEAKREFTAISSEIPMIGNGLRALVNPVTLAAAGTAALATGFIKATDAAAEFNHEFRDLANLNLDKTQNEILGLRNMVLDSAYRKGFDAKKTSNAYNEIQSTVGLYGEAARPIVERQGEFATLMKTDLDKYVAGTAKAMANWRFGVDRLDEFNKSNYAAMQVGVVSFDELAQVQSDFAGSAASINQSFDTANKLFSIFTVRTKSVGEAATLTRSLFNDLTRPTTVKAFKSVGIDLFNVRGELKQADAIMMELNRKFMQMKDDRSIVDLKNQFTGSEGLIAMIQAATDRTGELKNLLNEFSDSKFNADMALSQAHNDILYRQEKLTNRVNTLMIKLGEIALPYKEKIIGFAEKAVSNFDFYVNKNNSEREQTIESRAKASVNELYSSYLTNIDNITETELNERIKTLRELSNQAMNNYQTKTQEYLNDNFLNYNLFSYLQGRDGKLAYKDEQNGYDRPWEKGKSDAYKELAKTLEHTWYKNKDLINGKWYDKAKIDNASTTNNSENSDTSPTSLSSNSAGDSVNRVVGSAKQIRNITVNIEAFNKGGINTSNTTLNKMSANELDNWFTDVCLRAVRNVETSY